MNTLRPLAGPEFVARLLQEPAALRAASESHEAALAFLEAARWRGAAPSCPECGGDLHRMTGPRDDGRGRWRCKPCRVVVTPINGTPLEGERVPVEAALRALYLAQRHSGRYMELARAIASETGLTAASANRLALDSLDRVQCARDASGGGRRSQGRLRLVTVAAAVMLAVALGTVALAFGGDRSDPLESRWISGGQTYSVKTKPEQLESAVHLLQRHRERVLEHKSIFPPD